MKEKLLKIKAAWDSQQLKNAPEFIHELSDEILFEIKRTFKDKPELENSDISDLNLDLSSYHKRYEINKLLGELEDGLGVVKVVGLGGLDLSEKQLAQVFWAFGKHLGTPVSQSINGELLHRVEDQGYQLKDKNARGTNSSYKLWFHNDPCDVAGLLCVRAAKSGGMSQVVSSVAIHNQMLTHYPDLALELYKQQYIKRHDINKANKQLFFKQPIFAIEEDKFVCNILRPLIDMAHELDEIPDMSATLKLALDTFEDLAASKELCHSFYLQPGEMIWFNNFTTLHSRTAFTDYSEPFKKRLLYRLWLSVNNSRQLPIAYQSAYGSVVAGSIRGGIQPL